MVNLTHNDNLVLGQCGHHKPFRLRGLASQELHERLQVSLGVLHFRAVGPLDIAMCTASSEGTPGLLERVIDALPSIQPSAVFDADTAQIIEGRL